MSVTTEPTLAVHYSYSPNFSAVAAGELRDVRSIVLHDLEGSIESGLAVFAQAGGVSAHYAIGEDGAVWLVVPENAVAYHCAAFGADSTINRNRPTWLPALSGPLRYSRVNAVTIGIELAGYAARGFTPAQYTALGRLVADICQRWGLALTYLPWDEAYATVTTHGWLQTDRSDPGPHFDWAALIAAVAPPPRGEPDTDHPAPGEDPEMPELTALWERIAALEADQVTQNRRKFELERFLRETPLWTKHGRRYSRVSPTIADDLIATADAGAGAGGT